MSWPIKLDRRNYPTLKGGRGILITLAGPAAGPIATKLRAGKGAAEGSTAGLSSYPGCGSQPLTLAAAPSRLSRLRPRRLAGVVRGELRDRRPVKRLSASSKQRQEAVP